LAGVPLELPVPTLAVDGIVEHAQVLPVDAASCRSVVDYEVRPAARSVLIGDLRLEFVVDVAPEELVRNDELGLRPDQLTSLGLADERAT
jgi:hypothetical protein